MKFRLKITLCMLGLLSVLFGVGGSLLITLSFHTSLSREQDAAYNAYQTVIGTLQVVNRVNGQFDNSDISRTLEQLTGQNGSSWTAMQLYSKSNIIYEYNPSKLVKASKQTPSGKCKMRYDFSGKKGQVLALSGTLETDSETLYLDMTWDLSPLFETRDTQQNTFQWIFLLIAGLCALLSYSISRMLTSSLVKLSNASQAIAAGQLDSRVDIRANDEVGIVARDFNTMAETLEKNINDLKEAMEKQERFIGSLTHELKTPMTSIIGYADLIRTQTLSTDEQTQAANYIVSEGKRLENLSQKFLNLLLIKNSEIDFVKVSPAALIQSLAAHMEMIYQEQGITLSCDCEEGECMLEPDLVKTLLLNFWDNARKSMGDKKGTILVCSKMLKNGCQITIEDNGCGIPPEALDHLTEAFYRVDKSRSRKQGGVGLGLALCQEIVSLHGGTIRFESQVKKGTTVIVTLGGDAK